ncbi:MAG: WGR domain-containing protein [Kofleriaceae bacterium]
MARYEMASKFWDITLAGTRITTKFGKLGAAGQTKLKDFKTAAEAKAFHDQVIGEKTKKGYALAGGAGKPTKKPAAGAGQYFELVGGGSSKFWEVSLDGNAVKTRYGKIGSAGQTTVKGYRNPGEARSEHDKLVAEKSKKGYTLVRGDAPAASATTGGVHSHNVKLEAAIAAAPDDPDAYLVYADWLQSEGDLRGELMTLQHANKKAPAAKLIAKHPEHFWGPAAAHEDMLEAPPGALGPATTWRWGYLESLWFHMVSERSSMFGTPSLPEVDPEKLLAALLDHPSTQFLRDLTVGIMAFVDNSYTGTIKAIAKRQRPTLRTLVLGDFGSEETELNWSDIGKCAPLYQAVPNLQCLTLRSGSMKLGDIDLPKLRELTIITGGFDRGSMASVGKAKWPRLEKLSIQLGNEHKFTQKDLQPILDATAFPKVTHLGLGNADGADQICTWLAGSKIAGQLEELDLSHGTLGDAGALALAAAKPRFKQLKKLDVSDNWIGRAGLAALKGFAKTVEVGKSRRGQQDDGGDPEDRYIGAYE